MSRLHVFGDEAGDLVFKEPGNGISRYFMIGTVTLADCAVGEKFLALRRELAWGGILLDQLHATNDRQPSSAPIPSTSTSSPGISTSSSWPPRSPTPTTSF